MGRSTLSPCHLAGEALRLREVGCTLPVDCEKKNAILGFAISQI